jgi:hypothetical protein
MDYTNDDLPIPIPKRKHVNQIGKKQYIDCNDLKPVSSSTLAVLV